MGKGILVLGKGFIGGLLSRELGCPADGARITCYSDAARLIEKRKPRVLINCIGSTGRRNVDDCELEKDKVLLANSFVPLILAEACLRAGVKLVHIGTGCIFNFDYDKDKPIQEWGQDYFLKLFYSRSKIYSEAALQILSGDYNILVLRIRIPLLGARHPRNILDKLIKSGKVVDAPNSVTYIPDFIRAVRHLIKTGARGVYNVVNKGGLRYPDLMNIYRKYVPSYKFKMVSVKSLGLTRTNLILSTAKLEKSGFKIRHINSVLEECVKEYLKS
jgi:dTDP-4-dehydrorhamnose reductase